jgi:hypothetical protein
MHMWYNAVLLLIFGTTALIGINNVDKAISDFFSLTPHPAMVIVAVLITLVIISVVAAQLFRVRQKK